MGKNPPLKREMKEDAWMDGVINTPPIMTYIQYIHKSMIRGGRETGQAPPLHPQRRMPKSDCSDEEVDP